MKKIQFDWIWKSNRDNKKVCEAAGIEIMLGESHVLLYDASGFLLLEVNTTKNYSTGHIITQASNNSWKNYCKKNPDLFNSVDKKTNIANSWFGIRRNGQNL